MAERAKFSRQRGREGKGVVLRRPWLHDLGSTRTLVTLLRPWIRRFTMIICAWWLRTSSKFNGQVFEEIHWNKSYAGADYSKYDAVITIKSARTIQYLASDAVLWQDAKYALQPELEKWLVFALIILQLQLQPKIFNYNYNYSSSSNCNSITISITITMKRFSKHCDQFTYIRSLEFCVCQHYGFGLYFYTRPIKVPMLSNLVLPSIFV